MKTFIKMNPTSPKFRKDVQMNNLFKKLELQVSTTILRIGDKPKKGLLFVSIGFFFVYSLFMVSAWTLPFKPWLYLLLLAFSGCLCLPLLLNLGHESVHGTFSANKKINSAAGLIFIFLGTSKYFWKLRHVSAHHPFVNIQDWDMDISQSSIIRLTKTEQHQWYHKFQHLYMPLLFMIYTLVWFGFRDFKDISRKKFGKKNISSHPFKEVIFLITAKIWHITCLVIIPLFIGISLTWVILGFITYHICASMVTTFVLVSTHVGVTQTIVKTDQDGHIHHSWLEHQFNTTADFNTNQWWANWFFGGFNHHLAHHLFPGISHVYYPYITPIIKEFAYHHNLSYYSFDSLMITSMAHLKRLKNLSIQEEI